MTWLEFIAAMTGTLAWPAALVTIAFVYKRQLNSLLIRLKSASGFGASAEFEADLERAELTAETLPEIGAFEPDEESTAAIAYSKIASISPKAAILGKWADVEKRIGELVAPHGEPNVGRRLLARPSDLMSLGFLDYEGAKLLSDLRSLRNEAAHASGAGSNITSQQAERFIELSDQLLGSMGTFRPKG